MKIATTVELTSLEIREAIEDWAKKKFRKKELGPVTLVGVDGAHLGDKEVTATFELRDKTEGAPEPDEGS